VRGRRRLALRFQGRFPLGNESSRDAQHEYVHCVIIGVTLTVAMELAHNRRAG
jgi:hypothetical protein